MTGKMPEHGVNCLPSVSANHVSWQVVSRVVERAFFVVELFQMIRQATWLFDPDPCSS